MNLWKAVRFCCIQIFPSFISPPICSEKYNDIWNGKNNTISQLSIWNLVSLKHCKAVQYKMSLLLFKTHLNTVWENTGGSVFYNIIQNQPHSFQWNSIYGERKVISMLWSVFLTTVKHRALKYICIPWMYKKYAFAILAIFVLEISLHFTVYPISEASVSAECINWPA